MNHLIEPTNPGTEKPESDIRDKYENKVIVITDPTTIFNAFEGDQEAEDLLAKK